MTSTPPIVVGMLVHRIGHVAALNDKAVAGPIGNEGLPKMDMTSPGETGPVMKLAALVSRLIAGTGAATFNVTFTFVVPVATPVPAIVMAPEYVAPAFRPVGSTVTTRPTVPVLGVTHDIGAHRGDT